MLGWGSQMSTGIRIFLAAAITLFLGACGFSGDIASLCGVSDKTTNTVSCWGVRTWNQSPLGGTDEKSNSTPSSVP